MTKYPDGSILILAEEKVGIDELIMIANADKYLDGTVNKFIAKWKELNVGHADHCSMLFVYNAKENEK
jgi:hypothetical protein